ncbi:DNA polymerase III subunit delta' [Taylorella equigenitalis]|uniref:DNA polymerase III subunit delta' n=1 Tax=Taylorella equigenitalis TaxID=29575 RepID=UPI00237D7A51|nr:DNA polymerase III subunit delta' [Taylorella equigenitalis]
MALEVEVKEFYPWHFDIAKIWIQSKDRFSHAWLIYGQEGIGKFDFCLTAAKTILCKNANPFACNCCSSCHLMDKGNHIDFRVVVPESLREHYQISNKELEEYSSFNPSTGGKPSLEIKIDQIRELEEFFTLSPSLGSSKVIVLGPVETLNQASSNSLLKILEEPLGDTVFLLFTHAIQKVLPTILSRCQRLSLPIPTPEVATDWLIEKGLQNANELLLMASGAPLKALELSSSEYEPVHFWISDFIENLNFGTQIDYDFFVDKLDKIPNTQWVNSLQSLVADLLLSINGLEVRFYKSLEGEIRSIATKSSALKLTDLWKYLIDRQRLSSHPLNKKLFIHSCLQKVYICVGK